MIFIITTDKRKNHISRRKMSFNAEFMDAGEKIISTVSMPYEDRLTDKENKEIFITRAQETLNEQVKSISIKVTTSGWAAHSVHTPDELIAMTPETLDSAKCTWSDTDIARRMRYPSPAIYTRPAKLQEAKLKHHGSTY